MKKRFAAVCVVWVLCFVAIVTPKAVKVNSKSSMIVVPDDYATIQLAVNHAEEGDTVFVKKGTYHASVYIDKVLSLVAEGPNTKIINDYRLNGTVILIRHDNVNVSGFAIDCQSRSNSRRGIHLLHAKFCNVSGNSVTNGGCGIWLYGSSFNNIEGNNVIDNMHGITVALSDHNTFKENSVVDNFEAVDLSDSVDNIFRSNTLSLNSQNFAFSGTKSGYFNDVDSSNTIDKQPVCYWVNQHNRTVLSTVGHIILVNCTGITVQDAYVGKKYKEVLVVNTNRSEIKNVNCLVQLVSSFYNTVSECSGTVQLEASSHNMITKNNIGTADGKISLFDSSENIISSNTIQKGQGLVLQHNSKSNKVNANTLTKNYVAIAIYDSSRNSFRSNKLVDNEIPLYVSAQSQTLSDMFNYVDQTNTVNGKPIVYWVNETNKTVPPNAGEVILVNCSQILVENLTLTQGGIMLAWTTNSTITNNNLSDGQGIQLTRFSNDNTVSQNTLTENTNGVKASEGSRIQITENNITYSRSRGVQLQNCQNVNISNNIIVSNEYQGIALLDDARYNTVSNNHIAYNDVGIFVEGASENLISGNMILENIDWGIELLRDQHANRIYHNYFIDNSKGKWTLQVSIPAVNYHGKYIDGYSNIWDDGQKGNYWSEYETRYPEAQETEDTGTGDTPFYINPNNIDNHPITDPNIIPEFPSWTVLPLFFVAVIVAVFCKQKLPKHQQLS